MEVEDQADKPMWLESGKYLILRVWTQDDYDWILDLGPRITQQNFMPNTIVKYRIKLLSLWVSLKREEMKSYLVDDHSSRESLPELVDPLPPKPANDDKDHQVKEEIVKLNRDFSIEAASFLIGCERALVL